MQIKLRRDIASNWSAANPTLADGEIAWDKTNKKLKVGDGATAWEDLVAASGEQGPQGIQGVQGPTGPVGPAYAEVVVTKALSNADAQRIMLAYDTNHPLANRKWYRCTIPANNTTTMFDLYGDSSFASQANTVFYTTLEITNLSDQDHIIRVPNNDIVFLDGVYPEIPISKTTILSFMVVRDAGNYATVYCKTVGVFNA